MITKRNMLKSVLAGSTALALAGCGLVSSATVNGVTTITFNVAKANVFVQAIATFAKDLLADPILTAALGMVGVVAINAAVSGAAAAMQEITTEANGSATLVFNANSIPAAVESLLSDANSFISAVNTGVSAAKLTLSSSTQNIISGARTIVSLLLALVAAVGVGAPATAMSEAQALALAGLKPVSTK